MRLLDKLLGITPDLNNYADEQTMFGRAQVYDVEDDAGDIIRVLDIADSWQSASYLDERWSEPVFGYHRVFDRALGLPFPIETALMLGGGALSYPKHLVVQTNAQVDVVEVDPKVVELAETWFLLDRLTASQRGRLTVHIDDAMGYLRNAATADRRYVLIVNDLFAAERPTAELMAPQGLSLIRDLLLPEGIYATNVVSALKGRKARPLQQVEGALSQLFSQVETISFGEDDPRTPDNNVVFATNGAYSLSELLAAATS